MPSCVLVVMVRAGRRGGRLRGEVIPATSNGGRVARERVAENGSCRGLARRKLARWLLLLMGLGCSACGGERQPEEGGPGVACSFFAAGHVYGNPRTDVRECFYPPFWAGLKETLSDRQLDFGVLLGDVVFHLSGESWDRVDATLAELERAADARNLFVFTHQVLWRKLSALPEKVRVNSGLGAEDGQDFETELLPRFTSKV